MFSTLKKFSAILLLPIIFYGAPSVAQLEPEAKEPNHERLYQVELIVFGRSENSAQEHWPSDIKLTYPDNVAFLSESSISDNFTLVPASERQLNTQASTLARSGSYTLLYHQAWRQMIYANKTNIVITGGKTFSGHQELEGSISLNVGQYLKIQTNLWLTKFGPLGTESSEIWPELPSIPNTFANDIDKSQSHPIQRIVKLNQERTMRSNEIHYIDHPLMGVIIKIIPVDATVGKTN